MNQGTAIPRVAHPSRACPWCWRVMYPLTPFPVGQNATICKGHYAWLVRQVRAFYVPQQEKQGRNE